MQPKVEIWNPNENISIPSWINVEYFKDVLAKDEPESIGVQSFIPVAAVPPGENFTSIMLRIHMDLLMKDGSLKHKTYILKTMLEDDDIFSKLNLFPKEMEMYLKYLPAFEKLYQAVGWQIKMAPKCLFHEAKEGRINLVFEDLTESNFVNIDRLKGCNMEHVTKILRKLAEFHAVSAVYEERNGEYSYDFQTGFVDLDKAVDYQKSLFKNRMNPYKKAMQLWGLEDIDKYLKDFPNPDQYWKCGLSTLDQKYNNFNVLTHGDFWSNNMMFNYSASGSLNNLVFVDFQNCKWGSPAEDLLLFITISAAKDIRIKEFDHFVALYHERLVECLKILGYGKSIPKLRDLHKDIFDQNNTFYAFFACFNHLPVIMLSNDKDSSIHNFCRTDEFGDKFRMKAFLNPRYVEAMKDLYPFFYNRGLFKFSDYE